MTKIPCSVGLLTLNAGKGLRACLDSLKAFDEIIICDGNSTDDTLRIAQEYGVKVIRQYESEEENLPCVMDKAGVREKAMRHATHQWYFFMDADDTLSPEAVDEIRTIVESDTLPYLAYRMPTRIFIDGKEILHEATYPSYQTRLVHRSAKARYKGHVHERFVFDTPVNVGTLQNRYDFHWSSERAQAFWPYLKRYVAWELQTMTYRSFLHFLDFGIYRRVRTILGYLLWRLPFMYLRYGTRGTMPLSLELTIVRYHFAILFGGIFVYLGSRAPIRILIETLKGKDLNRVLSNWSLRTTLLYGKVLDVGGGKNASYYRFLNTRLWHRVVRLDIDASVAPDICADLEQGLPVAAKSFDQVLMMNVLEHLRARQRVLTNVRESLKEGGTLVGIIPFMVRVHPDPHDFVRLTREGLVAALEEAGFKDIKVEAIGWGPFSAAYSQTEFILPRILKPFILPVLWLLDTVLMKFVRTPLEASEQFPLSYYFSASR